ncbi:MAG: CRTAC1 family protein [Paracoccaceae bacterium]
MPETMGPGVAFLDANQDDWPDILVIGGGSPDPRASVKTPAMQLYLNDGSGNFLLSRGQSGLADLRAYGFGICAADHDNDGDTDAVMTALDGAYLLHNVGGDYQPRRLELGGNTGWTGAATFLDVENDGRLDLFISHYVDWSPVNDLYCSNDGIAKSYCTPEAYRGLPPLLLRNTRNGFADVTDSAGLVGLPGKSLGATLLDYNDDGWTDLFVANDTERDLLLQNLGNGRFAEVGRNLGVAYDEAGKTRAGMGVAAGYLDETGQPSLLVTNFSREMIGVYRYDGSRIFTDRALTSGIGAPSVPTLGFGLALADFDLDGDLDLFVGNGHVHHSGLPDGTEIEQPPHLFVNDGTGKFSDIVPAGDTGLSEPMLTRGVAHADYDRDGDIDILVADNRGPLRLWRNETKTHGASLRIHLQGTASNRDGIGARLTIRASGRTMRHVVTSCGSYQSSSELAATFGLPPDTLANIEIAWPSGVIEEIRGVAAGQEILIQESSGSYVVLDKDT